MFRSRAEYDSRHYIYAHIITDIERGLKPKSRQKVSLWIKERILYNFETLEILHNRHIE